MKIIRVDVRVIAATNRDLDAEVRAGRFREDLYYRLHVFPVTLPPLRERREDIPDLVDHFIQKYTERIQKSVRGVNRDAMDMLLAAPWPGNIRELENEIERAVTLADSDGTITRDILSQRLRHVQTTQDKPSADSSLKERVEALEIELIKDALRETGGNILKAAQRLQMSRAGLHKKLQRYGIEARKL
jgi:transcriptional regulator with PAS, ATPase and Fis domain